jgi:hypothetical protein
MTPTELRPVCPLCGDRIGVYEPIWLERPDGTLVRSGLLALKDTRADGRIFHSGCLSCTELAD